MDPNVCLVGFNAYVKSTITPVIFSKLDLLKKNIFSLTELRDFDPKALLKPSSNCLTLILYQNIFDVKSEYILLYFHAVLFR